MWLRSNPKRVILLLAALSFLPAALYPHGSLHLKIKKATEEIGKQPGNAGLFAVRGDLFRYHQEFKASEKDFRRALRLQPGLLEADFGLASLYLDWGKPGLGLAPISEFLAARPKDEKCLGLKARLLASLGRHQEAASTYEEALRRPGHETVEHRLEMARCLVKVGQAEKALASLDQGSRSMGGLAVFEKEALEIEISMGRKEEALRRNQRLLEAALRKEFHWFQRGEILALLGRSQGAAAAWREALAQIDRLPVEKRSVGAVADLRAKLMTRLEP